MNNNLTDDQKRQYVKSVRKGWRNYCLTLVVLSGGNAVFWFIYMRHNYVEWVSTIAAISVFIFLGCVMFAWNSLYYYIIGKTYVNLKSVTKIEDYFK